MYINRKVDRNTIQLLYIGIVVQKRKKILL